MTLTKRKLNTMFRYLSNQSNVEIYTVFRSFNSSNHQTIFGKIVDYIIVEGNGFAVHVDIQTENGIRKIDTFIPLHSWFNNFGEIEWFNDGARCLFKAKTY